MPNAIKTYVRCVDAVNRRVGKLALYLVFVMMGILLFSSISRTFFNVPFDWTMEMAQFTMAAYYLLGGGYSMQLQAHVRMDVLYERWSERKRAMVDVLTSGFLIFYLAVLLYGGISSTLYSLEYGQRNYSSWGPPMAPIKIIMVIGIILMLLQAVAVFFKDLAKARGKELV
ncbi:MAG: TRAP transporter small permease subunit [Proteobacteria bacterium]|nr:TRAP transporter small permease subunit [Desulfobacula sp.]MBU3951036.1 TRAP transporter small permease subunit [Pseudomonadota bacterium]MBU4130109.1 TRAP transporter small permease subunit [Pseudomonadota bacterium]